MIFATTPETIGSLVRALEQGEAITPTMRHQLLESLYDFGLFLVIEEKKSQRGRVPAVSTWIAAAITMRLVDEYGVKVKAAARAAAPNSDMDDAAIKRAYRKLRAGEFSLPFELHPDLVSEAVDRLDPTGLLFLKKFKSSIKSGNK